MDSYLLSLALFTLSVSVLLYLYLTLSNSNTKNVNLPPSPPKIPIFGNLHQLGYLPHHSLRALSKKYGPLMLLQLGSKPMLVISSPDVAKEFLKTHDVLFSNRPDLDTARRVLYHPKDVITAPYGDHLRNARSILAHQLFSTKKIKSLKLIIQEEITLLVQEIGDPAYDGTVNLSKLIESLLADITSRSAFGEKFSETEYGKKAINVVNEGLGLLMNFNNIGDFIPWLSWISKLTGFEAAVSKVLKTRDEIFDEIIQERLDGELSIKNIKNRGNIMNTLLDIYMEEGNNNSEDGSIDMETVRAILLNVFVTATETTGGTLEWAMAELIRHPTIMKKLQDEVKEIMNGKEDIGENELKSMTYLKAVIKETLRYHPPLVLNPRCNKEEVNIMGYDIPAKTGVLINIWAICRDPSYWDEPEEYMPERFLNSSIDYMGSHFHYFPFGCGRRICPGITFGTEILEYVLANLMHKFNWSLPNGAKGEDMDVTEKFGFTIGKKEPLLAVATKSSS